MVRVYMPTCVSQFIVFPANSCPANFTGTTCETNVDECLVLSNPCKNGATCTDVYGGYLCRCISGWEGFDCSINKDDCITQAHWPPQRQTRKDYVCREN